jgi:hypothetical protein
VIATDEHTVKQKAAMLKRGGSFASRCCLGGQTVNVNVRGIGTENNLL